MVKTWPCVYLQWVQGVLISNRARSGDDEGWAWLPGASVGKRCGCILHRLADRAIRTQRYVGASALGICDGGGRSCRKGALVVLSDGLVCWSL